MSRPTLAEDRRTFLSALRKIDSSIGNLSLRSSLGWTEDRYWKVHANLLSDGLITRGRGRGGSVRRARQHGQRR